MFGYCRFLSLLFFCVNIYSQNIWEFSQNKNKISIPFQLLNNAIIVQPKINNVQLNLILDTGSAYNILFGFPEKDSIAFYNTFKIKITGPGMDEPVDAFVSKKNKIEFKNISSKNFDLILMMEEKIDFYTNMGLPIHGILGADFFKNNRVEIQYDSKKIIVYRKETLSYKKKIEVYNKIPFVLKDFKPFIPVEMTLDENEIQKLELLVDTGLSDGLWVFENELNIKGKKYIVDYLGSGIGGSIFGKRVRFKNIKFSDFEFENPIISIPDTISFVKKSILNTRDGSFGGDILRRFNVIFDYENLQMYIKKNSNYKEKFYYNIAGVDLHYNGIEIVKEKIENSFNTFAFFEDVNKKDAKENYKTFNVRYKVKPGIEIAYIRKNSIADKAGLKIDDKIISVNGKKTSNFKLQEIIEIFQKNNEESVVIEIERLGKIYMYELYLKEEI